MNFLRVIFSTLIVFIAMTPAHAQNEPLVKVRILPERTSIKGGDEIWIGTEQSITPEWHTYWKNPGDSGTATNITWTVPDGFEVSEILWPTPKKIPYPPLLNYGYEGQAILLQKLKVPETLPEGPITLTADVDILVCKEECIPEYGTYTVTLNGPNAALENNSAYLKASASNLPQKANWDVTFSNQNDNFTLDIKLPQALHGEVETKSVQFFPHDWGIIKNPATPRVEITDDMLTLSQERGDRSIDALETTSGVLVFKTISGETQSREVTANKSTNIFNALTSPSLTPTPAAESNGNALGFIHAIIFALIGGLILNLMPCVFPVLSIKALSLVKTAEKHPTIARIHGLSYTAGVILSFLAIAGILIILQTSGAQIGWGFQLQNPVIVGALSYLLFILGLNLMGFFEFTNPFANAGGRLANQNGFAGSFFTGVLATFVAAPCTAPFMAGALGFAFVQPPLIALTVFAALGLGLALPYLALSFVPALQKIMPKPGAWMNTFKQALSFPMFLAALWLLWVLAQQSDVMGLTAVLLGAVLITFSIWLFKSAPTQTISRLITKLIAIFTLGIAIVLLSIPAKFQNSDTLKDYTFGAPYSKTVLEEALNGDAPIFTEMTAAWCITCKVNHAVAINVGSTKTLFANNNVQYLIGDWTNEDPAITQYLKQFDRNGVPLYVFYGARDPVTKQRPDPKLLPQVLTPAIVQDYITEKP